MLKKRRQFIPEFKAQDVLEVLTGVPSPAEACRKHGLSAHRLTSWKAPLLERAASVFQAEAQRDEDQTRITELEQLVGRLTPEKEILTRRSRNQPG